MDKETSTRISLLCSELTTILSDPRPGSLEWVTRRDAAAQTLRNALVEYFRPSTVDVSGSRDLLGSAYDMWPGLYDTLLQGYQDTEVVSTPNTCVFDPQWRTAYAHEAERMATLGMIAFLDQHAEERIAVEVAQSFRCGHCEQKLPVGISKCQNCGAVTVRTERGSRTRPASSR